MAWAMQAESDPAALAVWLSSQPPSPFFLSFLSCESPTRFLVLTCSASFRRIFTFLSHIHYRVFFPRLQVPRTPSTFLLTRDNVAAISLLFLLSKPIYLPQIVFCFFLCLNKMIPTNFANAINVVIQSAALAAQPPAPSVSTLLGTAPRLAASIKASFPNPNLALLPQPIWWWQSGTAVEALLTYTSVTGDHQYEPILQNTILSQATPGDDFLTVDATGNDDQAWWALAAATAAEVKLPDTNPNATWLDLARNVYEQQKARWGNEKKGSGGCKGGLGWKIAKGDGNDGFFYKNSISNGLLFQLAARVAQLSAVQNETAAAEMSAWANTVYDWSVQVGLVNDQFDVFDGTDEKNGCADLNHNQWSYNVGVYMYGSAVMAVQTGDAKWVQRTRGFIQSANRTFVNHDTGALWEATCEKDKSCDADQISFKGLLARWLGATAEILPQVSLDAKAIVSRAANAALKGTMDGLGPIDSFNALELMCASLKTQEVQGDEGGMIGLRRARRGVARQV